jgi:hypothetical protein
MSIAATMLTTLAEFRPDHHPAGAAGGASSILGAIFGLVFGLFALVVGLIMVASSWKIFTKAGEEGWMSIIPVLNIIILLKITRKPVWWVVLFFIPFVNVVAAFLVHMELAKVFGQGMGFVIGMVFLPFIFYPMLAFGSARYNPAYA